MARSHSSSESKSRGSVPTQPDNPQQKKSQKNKRTRAQTENHSPNTSPDKKKLAGDTVEDGASSISSTQQTYRPPPPVNYQPQFTTPNPFDPIAPEEDEEEAIEQSQEDIQLQDKPPVINIKNVTNFINVCKSISSVVGDLSFTCKARTDVLSIQAINSDTYRKIIKHLQAIGLEHYTFQFKCEKPYRVVIRHLHPKTPVDLIKEELEKIGFSVIDACNVLQRSSRTPLPLFFINLKPAQNNKDIFSLRTLLYTSIKVEEPHKKEDLPQCTRCQGFNHTKKYCNVNPVCVKCAGPHLTQTCTKTRDTPATCAHCHQHHPANYRGCTVYKDLVSRLRSRSGQRAASRPQPAVSQPPAATSSSALLNLAPALPQREVPHSRPATSAEGTRPSFASAAKSPLLHSNTLSQPQPSSNPPQRPSRVFIPPPNLSSHFATNPTALNNLNILINNLKDLISPLTDLLKQVTSILSALQP